MTSNPIQPKYPMSSHLPDVGCLSDVGCPLSQQPTSDFEFRKKKRDILLLLRYTWESLPEEALTDTLSVEDPGLNESRIYKKRDI